jgi:predicted porin
VRGQEDLGDGLKAIFNLESPVDAKNGSVGGGASSGACNPANPKCTPATGMAFWRRNAYVGFSHGQYGELTLGRYYTGAIIKQAPTLSAQPSGINTGLATTLNAQGLSNDFWNSNQVRYDSPKLGPIDFSAHVAAGEGSTGRNFGGNIRFMQGPFVASLSYQDDRDTEHDEVKWMIVSATWDFGVFKLHAAYDNVDNNGAWNDGVTLGPGNTGGHGVAGFIDSQFWSVGGAFKATPQLTVSAQYWGMKEKVYDTKSKILVLNADYALSKRTFLYALFGHADNGMMAVAPLWGNQNFGATNPGNVAVANDKVSGLALGIRHVF